MNDLLEKIDKYKFGIVAALATYFLLFVYLQLPNVEYTYYVSPYLLDAEMEIPQDEIKLQPENIMVNPRQMSQEDVKNAVRDVNDKRERSDKNWSTNPSTQSAEDDVRDFEKKMFEEAGGDKERARIQQEMDKRKQDQQNKKNNTKQPNNQSQSGAPNAPKGAVLVDYDLKGRNKNYLPAPGYMCDQGATGTITVRVKVEQSGYVSDAKFEPSMSTSSNGCMVQYALEFARKSRFNYSGTAPAMQDGFIIYKFVYQ